MKKQFEAILPKALAIVIGAAVGIAVMLLISVAFKEESDDELTEQIVVLDSEKGTAVIVGLKDDEVVSKITIPVSYVIEIKAEPSAESSATQAPVTAAATNCKHSWVEATETVEVPETGHMVSTQNENVWVVDTPATTETKVVGYKCSRCGTIKQEDLNSR